MLIEYFLFVAAIIILAGIFLGKVGHKFGIPALLLFLVTGMAFGVDGVGLKFEDMRVAQWIGVVALTIILFSGGMDTKIKEIRPVLLQGVMLSTLGVLLTTLFTGTIIYFLTHSFFDSIVFSFPLSLLLASTMSSTDSASVFAILRSQNIHLKENLKPMLELESGSNDPMAYMLTIVLIDLLLKGSSGDVSLTSILSTLALQFLVGIVGGFLTGKLAVKIINRLQIHNDTLYPITLLCIVLVAFSSTSILDGNGYLAVYIAGIVVGDAKIVKKRVIFSFFDGMTWLLQLVLFIMLGLLVNPHEMASTMGLALTIGVLMMFVARPLAVFLSLLPMRRISFRARLFVSWIGLRGAAPILFATYPVLSHVPHSDQIFNIVFFITIVSLIFQGMTIRPIAQLLHLAEPAPAEGYFTGVEIPEETGTIMEERRVTEKMLRNGHELKNLPLDAEELVIMVRRKERFIVPKGNLKLSVDDMLLVVSPNRLEKEDAHPLAVDKIKALLNG